MSQDVFSSIDPAISGDDLATTLDAFKDAIVSSMSGTARPAELSAGGTWLDITNDPTYWSLMMYTGSTDVEIFRLTLATSVASIGNATSEFNIKRVSADTTGAILKLIKQRILNNGQVLNNDVVGEVRLYGRADDSSNPVVAKLIWTATDDMTTTNFGGTLSFQSVADATDDLVEHMRFIGGLVETVLPVKLNSLRLVGQNVATAATIVALDATKVLVELTGATAGDLQGINAAQDSQVVTIHNRSTANFTLKHQNGTASAADRLKLPGGTDYVLVPEASATLYYCTTDALWKLLSTADRSFNGYTVNTYYGVTNSFTAATSLARVRAYRKLQGMTNEFPGFIDVWGNAYMWGVNTQGNLGLGDVTSRSSPVAVLGSKVFSKVFGNSKGISGEMTNFGIDTTGILYSWGANTNGQLGLGDVTPRSSPVAVLGGLKVIHFYNRDTHAYAINNAGALYAWGANTNGELGVGDVTPRSSPVAVLGGLTFAKIVSTSSSSGSISVVAFTRAGAAYTWGYTTAAQPLGVGDINPRSSPVAVLGGLTFKDIVATGGGTYLGLTSAGSAYAWGGNVNGQIGAGDVNPRSSPVAVLGGLTFTKIFGHPQDTGSFFGLTSAGVLYAWGINSAGNLGLGDAVSRSSPVAVLGGLTFAKVYPYKNRVYALTAGGALYAWGDNTNGCLGVGDVVARSSPVAVLGGLTFSDVIFPANSTDVTTVWGVTGDGSLYAWGANAQGTAGVGDTTVRSSPVAVVGGFRPDMTQPSYSSDIALTNGQSYTITIPDGGIATFAGTPLGLNIARVEVEYLQ